MDAPAKATSVHIELATNAGAAFLAVENESSLARLRSQLLLKRFVVPDGSVFNLQKSRASDVEREGTAWP